MLPIAARLSLAAMREDRNKAGGFPHIRRRRQNSSRFALNADEDVRVPGII